MPPRPGAGEMPPSTATPVPAPSAAQASKRHLVTAHRTPTPAGMAYQYVVKTLHQLQCVPRALWLSTDQERLAMGPTMNVEAPLPHSRYRSDPLV